MEVDQPLEAEQIAAKYWLSEKANFDENVVRDLYQRYIVLSGFNYRSIMQLELTQYLEKYLWPHYNPSINDTQYMLSIVVLVNEKFREKIPAFDVFKRKPEHFGNFFSKITKITLNADDYKLSMKERTSLLIFLIHCFNGIEVDLIREQIQKFVSFPIWCNISRARLEREFNQTPKFRKVWNTLAKKDKKLSEEDLKQVLFERQFLWNLMHQFFDYLSVIPSKEHAVNLSKDQVQIVRYCERFVEFLIDLEALLPTRRFFNTLLDDCHLLVLAKKTNLANRDEGRLFNQLIEMLKFYANFEIDDITGEALTDKDITKIHYSNMAQLQKIIFKNFPEMRSFYISNISMIDTREALMKHFEKLDDEQLLKLASLLKYAEAESEKTIDRELMLELLVQRHERAKSQLQALNVMPLYPTENIIWDENVVPSQYFSGDACLALPKLNLQFLTLHDYLLRNFHLFRLESTYEIRQDIEDAVSRMKPWQTENGGVMFGGWARMALKIDDFAIIEVAKPKIGEKQPTRVRADVVVNLNVRHGVKSEWESLRKHDVCFLVCVRPTCPPGTPYKYKEPFIPQVGLTYVRGCEIEGMLDSQGKIIEEGFSDKPIFTTDNRTYRVWLDCNQYKSDMDKAAQGEDDVYDSFNLIVRRKPKENNFKAVLETIRDLMNADCVVPEWLHDVILGYGDPAAAHYSNLPNNPKMLDFNDTFIDVEHLKNSFPKCEVKFEETNIEKLVPPFKIQFNEDATISALPYVLPNRGPYVFEQPQKNAVRFTPTQVEAIKSGIQHGLTMVVGPPGTGKVRLVTKVLNTYFMN